jgi:hypothetical protein
MFRRSCTLLFVVIVSVFLRAQFGPQEPQGSGPKLNAPTVFPPPGIYPTTESITLLDDDPQATITTHSTAACPRPKARCSTRRRSCSLPEFTMVTEA